MSLFKTTRWSLVADARHFAGNGALAELCAAYRPPVLAYLRSHGYSETQADDLTQAFFEHLLRHHAWERADPAKGRFRSFLLDTLKHFLAHQRERQHAAKRGGGRNDEALDEALADPGAGPEEAYEREFALTVVANALKRLEQEAVAAHRHELFQRLKEYLVEPPDAQDYHVLADTLQMRRNTLAVTVHRMRHRLQALVLEELARATPDHNALPAEMAALRRALHAPSSLPE
ncbi:MAG: sigma factor [Pseudoxanthomonas sp.]